ncbi:unnamed protein product, partial [Mesorhabditis spiculigera]
MRTLLLLAIISLSSAYVSPHWYTQCFRRNLRVGDLIRVKGSIISGATRWTCNIAMSEMNNIILHADHRIRPTRVEGARGTYVNIRPGMGGWVHKNYHAAIPFSGGPFEMSFRIIAENTVEVVYNSTTFAGTTYNRGKHIPLSVVRQIDCNGDLMDVTFHGDMMRDKVLPVKSRSDCMMFPPSPPPRSRSREHPHHSHSHDWSHSHSHSDSGSHDRGFDDFNIELPRFGRD